MIVDVLDIGDVVEQTGVPVSTLHVWEREGLIAPIGRAGLRRQYSLDVTSRIAIIKLGQQCGFSLGEIRELLSLDDYSDRTNRFTAKLTELYERRASIEHAIELLEHGVSCEHRPSGQCPTFQSLLRDSIVGDPAPSS